ncbi:mannose-1-phosphate guanylyltransferase/mannose-6-phosphate isomerase [Prochlorococcus marinus]|uniref:mannose-1-phosphate guanylyltransferase n=1 Tax=Prochlorococcus marinus (strain AS9601) TaxID=146891 RepID=A2BSC1_PROMS|nr:mannose-1-phosphate guanylyltransferase/mannose-6-phosphate isomerase [Prochlorococcus marinus]ABM70682.1 Mannose-1-phosphate guanylyltransferase [Prochlorococcus marinus str. AS9601]
MNSKVIIPVILCGGSGSRLWPLSRKSLPKQFLSLNPENKKSLLQQTYQRVKNIKNCSGPIIICNEEHRFIVAEQMREIKIKPTAIILEPFGRNTCPAITLACLEAIKYSKDPFLLILSSDHIVQSEKKFQEVISKGTNYAEQGRIVTFGIIPKSPQTGFGYIESEYPFKENSLDGHNIIRFIEKPDLKTAKKFIKDRKFVWNSGIFLFQPSVILKEIQKFNPEIIKCCKKSLSNKEIDLDFTRINQEEFSKCPNLSIDFSIMEKTDLGTVLPLDAGWDDIGSWESLWQISKKDSKGNVFQGNVIGEKTENCYLRSENRLIVGLGIKDLITIETRDAILVADKQKSQDVKDIVSLLKKSNIPEGLTHKKVYRPWGNYLSLVEDSKWQVKLISVNPGEKLSLQRHKFRAEHWVVVEGVAKVEIDKKVLILEDNQSTFIPVGAKHRLSNCGKEILNIIEVQSGTYLGEDDIERFEDNYGRLNS